MTADIKYNRISADILIHRVKLMKIKFWGVRGSIPTPLDSDEIYDKLKEALDLMTLHDAKSDSAKKAFLDSLPISLRGTYGGNSTCLQVIPDSGDTIIIDCGSGIKKLGNELMKTEFGRGEGNANILITHTHWNHIQGIPFFMPFFVPGNRFTFYSPIKDLKKRIEYQQIFTHFPVNLDYMSSTKEFAELEGDSEFVLNGISIINKRFRHPGGSFGYRIEENGKTFCFTSDCEFNLDELDNIGSYESFFRNADVCVFDAQYTFDESVNKIDWGHSSASIAIDIAARFGVKKLILFHHDPDYNDKKIEQVLANAKSYLSVNKQKKRSDLEIDIAVEGSILEI